MATFTSRRLIPVNYNKQFNIKLSTSLSALALPLALQYPGAYIYATLARHFRTSFV